MKRCPTFLAVLVVGLAFLAVHEAEALSISLLASDADFLADAAATSWVKEFGGNVRWGNNAANGDWEFSVVNEADFPQDQVNTAISGAHPLIFDYSSGAASLAVGQLGLSEWAPLPVGQLNTMYIRAKADTDNVSVMDNLYLTVGGVGYDLGTLAGDCNAQYLKIVDSGFSGDWQLTGTGALSADGTPRGSDPMYQVKIGITSVPDVAGTAILLGIALGSFGMLRSRI